MATLSFEKHPNLLFHIVIKYSLLLPRYNISSAIWLYLCENAYCHSWKMYIHWPTCHNISFLLGIQISHNSFSFASYAYFSEYLQAPKCVFKSFNILAAAMNILGRAMYCNVLDKMPFACSYEFFDLFRSLMQ